MNRDELLRVLRAFEREGPTDMPVERFRSIEEMNAAPIRVMAGDPFDRFLRLCRRYWLLAPKRYPRGVFKFRSIEEAQAARERVSREAALPRDESGENLP